MNLESDFLTPVHIPNKLLELYFADFAIKCFPDLYLINASIGFVYKKLCSSFLNVNALKAKITTSFEPVN